MTGRSGPTPLMKTLLCNLSILCVWYLAEYAQFGKLQHGRNGDDIVFILYFILTWALFRKLDRNAAPGNHGDYNYDKKKEEGR